jgi:hypothetical protein
MNKIAEDCKAMETKKTQCDACENLVDCSNNKVSCTQKFVVDEDPQEVIEIGKAA